MRAPQGTNEYGHIVRGDVYGVRYLKATDVDFVFDLGANVGYFTMMARFLFPAATIVAVEPMPDMLSALEENVAELGVYVEKVAVADGQPMKLARRGHPLDTMLVDDRWTGTVEQEIPTVRLSELLNRYGCTDKHRYLLKINCEGGERFFIGNPEDEAALLGARHIGMMIHFKSETTQFVHWPEYREISDWVVRLFKSTHSIWYGNSSRTRGRGYFQLKRFDLPKTKDEVRAVYEQDPAKLYQDVFFYKRSGGQFKRSVWWGKGIVEVLGCKSVVDFGCGLGGFLLGALDAGAKEVRGYDVGFDSAKFWIPRHLLPHIHYGNVARPLSCGEWDCVLCVEVAEHLLPEESETLLDNISRAAADKVVFVPSPRRGYYHLNIQPYEYWIGKMGLRGFKINTDLTGKLKAKWREYKAPEYMVLNAMVFERDREEDLELALAEYDEKCNG